MLLAWTPEAWEYCLSWQKADKAGLRRINGLIRDIARNPFTGLDKPEPLRFNLAGCWLRRIDSEHRLVYTSDGASISCRVDARPRVVILGA